MLGLLIVMDPFHFGHPAVLPRLRKWSQWVLTHTQSMRSIIVYYTYAPVLCSHIDCHSSRNFWLQLMIRSYTSLSIYISPSPLPHSCGFWEGMAEGGATSGRIGRIFAIWCAFAYIVPGVFLICFQWEVHQQHIETNRAYSRGSTRYKYDLVELVLERFYSLSTRINPALPKWLAGF